MPVLEARKTELGKRIAKEAQKAVNQFGRYSEAQLRRLRDLYIEARKNINKQIVEKWGVWVKEPTSPLAISRLRDLQTAIDGQIDILNRQLDDFIPTALNGAGDMGIATGQKELALLLHEFPRLEPSFTVLNKDAISVYSNYALQLSKQYSAEAVRQIQSALQMGLIEQKTIGQLTSQIRQYLGAEPRKPARKITYKAQTIAQTEMARAYSAGHSAFGNSCDFIRGETLHTNPMAPWPCSECESLEASGKVYYYDEGETAPIPVHPRCHCYPVYVYRKDLFTKEEIENLKKDVKLEIKKGIIKI